MARNPDNCPICGEYMEILCTGHRHTVFVTGKKYQEICFVCFSTPKTWVVKWGKAEDGSEDIWEGPYFDKYHLHTATELVEDGATNSRSRAQKSITAIKKKAKSYTPPPKEKEPESIPVKVKSYAPPPKKPLIELTEKEWKKIEGIGATTAKRLVEYGPYDDFNKMLEVKGVSEAMIARIKNYLN